MKNYDTARTNLNADLDFCFKCHRMDTPHEKKAQVFPVNGFTFNQEYNTFASYGGDGVIATWNKDTKSKYRGSKRFPHPIVAGNFSDDGEYLAFAIGCDYQKGYEEMRAIQFSNHIIIRANDIKTEVFKRR